MCSSSLSEPRIPMPGLARDKTRTSHLFLEFIHCYLLAMNMILEGRVSDRFAFLDLVQSVTATNVDAHGEDAGPSKSFHCSGKCTMSCGKTMACI
jgi:hypothetical protein